MSPQPPETNAETQRKLRLGYPILSDAGNAYARQLELVFALPEDLRGVYRQFGIDLAQANGDESWTLPLPTRLVVDAQGIIRAIDADPDYTVRPEPSATLAALQALG